MKKEREEAEKYGDILFATYAMAKEGLDIERLNTVILATSQKDVIQSVGRAMRKILTDGDLRPMIIDFSDHLSAFINHTKKRKAFYLQSKFIIEDFYLIDDDFANDDFEKDSTMNYVDSLNVELVSCEDIKIDKDDSENDTEDDKKDDKIDKDDSEDDTQKVKKEKKKTIPKIIYFKKRLKF